MKRSVLLILALLVLCAGVYAGGRRSGSSSSRSSSSRSSSSSSLAAEADFIVALGTDNRTALIKEYVGRGGAVNIPEVIQGMPVVQISDGAFRGSRVTEVELPEGITAIGANAFADCQRLERITLSRTVRTIGTGAFNGCRALTEIIFPEGARITFSGNTFTGTNLLLGVQAQLRTLGYTGTF